MRRGECKGSTSGGKFNWQKVKQVLGVRAEVSTGLVWSNHFEKVDWLLVLKDFEGDDCYFENYPPFYRQPVEFRQQRCNVVKLPRRRKGDPGKNIHIWHTENLR